LEAVRDLRISHETLKAFVVLSDSGGTALPSYGDRNDMRQIGRESAKVEGNARLTLCGKCER
jgi:hypothetical protein